MLLHLNIVIKLYLYIYKYIRRTYLHTLYVNLQHCHLFGPEVNRAWAQLRLNGLFIPIYILERTKFVVFFCCLSIW